MKEKARVTEEPVLPAGAGGRAIGTVRHYCAPGLGSCSWWDGLNMAAYPASQGVSQTQEHSLDHGRAHSSPLLTGSPHLDTAQGPSRAWVDKQLLSF